MLIGIKPLKARLVIQEGRSRVLVMKVTLSDGETIGLASGGTLDSLPGVVRIRERSEPRRRSRSTALGTLVYVPGGAVAGAAKYQIDVTLGARNFDALVGVALTGALPAKFFIDAGGRASARAPGGLRFASTPAGTIKLWDTTTHRILPVTHFSAILPVALFGSAPDPRVESAPAVRAAADGAQLLELADEILASQAESRTSLVGVLAIIAIIAMLILLANLVLVFR